MTLRHLAEEVATTVGLQCDSPLIHLGFCSLFIRYMSTGTKRHVEAVWKDFFSNTSQWLDHRSEKQINPRFPDFKHKQTGAGLWLHDARNPAWVQEKLAAIPSGTLQSNAFAWAQRLKRYVKAGQYMKTLEIFRQMQQEGICPDGRTFLPVLNACAGLEALEEGKRIHTQIIRVGCDSDVYVGTCLIDMYAKCGSIVDAWNVFKRMQEHTVVSWNVMIGCYVKSRQGLKAIELFDKMQQEGVEPSTVTFVGVLNACGSVAALGKGRHIHEQIIQRGWESDDYVATCLVDMYVKCGSIGDAWTVFNKKREHDVVSWTAMIGGYVKSGQGHKAMELFQKMQQEGVEPNAVTFVKVLNACASLEDLEQGRRLHDQIIQRGWESDHYVATCLVDMYGKCGSIQDAWIVFEKMREHNLTSWNAMIAGYVKSGQGLEAIKLFQRMKEKGVEPDGVTFVGVLNACASVAALEEGKRVHEQIIRRGHESNDYVATCLVDMYAKCGSIEDAWDMFNKMEKHDVVAWSAIIGGHVKSGQGLKAMELFQRMQQEGVEPDAVTFVGLLNACASVAALKEGRDVHEHIIRRGYESNVCVATCLVDMYAKCGSTGDAWSVFNKMPKHNVVSWSAMIGGYVKCGQGLKAMKLFQIMQQEGVEPNTLTFVGVLNACAAVGALEEGRQFHEQIIHRGFQSHLYVANCLVDMYSKCGSIEDAWNVFNKMQEHNVVSWNAMIGGYAMHGHAKKAIGLFKQMRKEGVDINEVTFTCLLSACSHGGLVKKALRLFNAIPSRYDLLPTMEHYACMIDLLGRAGQLDKAEEIMKMMPLEGDIAVWMSLLGACRIHGNIEIAERAAKWCWVLDPENASAHVLLSNTYAAAVKRDGSAATKDIKVDREQLRLSGRAFIVVNNVVHSFVVNKRHPQILKISAELERLSTQMYEAGYHSRHDVCAS